MDNKTVFQDWVLPEEQLFLAIPAYGRVLPDPAYRMTPVGVYMLSYIVSGKGAILSEDGIVPVKAGDFCCIRSGAEVICRADFDDPYEKRWFFCRGRLLDSLCNLYTIPPIFTQSFDADGFFSQWEQLCNVPCPHRGEMETVCTSLTRSFSALFAALRMHDVLALPPTAEDVTYAIRDYLDSRLSASVTLSDIAERFGYTEMHIIRLFREEFGIPPMQYIHTKRMEHAAELLQETALSLRTIAAACGYRDVNHFSAAFKKHTGMSPRTYRTAKTGKATL